MLRGCIVGCGAISTMHAMGIKATEYGVLEAVCDILPERADKAATEYGCRALYSFEEVLDDPNIDVVHICTPHHLHVEMTVRALRAGKHVLQEKPVALSREDLKALMDAEKETGKHVCVSLQTRSNAGIKKLAEIIKTDASIGKLTGVTGVLVWNRGKAYYKKDGWRGRWATEGGSLLCNQAIHTLDLMHYFAGPAKRVRAHIATNWWDDIIETEDTANALIEFENGVRGVFFGTNTYTSSSPAMIELDFEHARFRYADQALYRIDPQGQAECLQKDARKTPGKVVWGSGHPQLIQDFYQFLAEGKGTYLSLADALPSAMTLLSMYESGKAGNVWTDVSK